MDFYEIKRKKCVVSIKEIGRRSVVQKMVFLLCDLTPAPYTAD